MRKLLLLFLSFHALSFTYPNRTYIENVNVPTISLSTVVIDKQTKATYVNNLKQNNPFNIRTNNRNNWVGKITKQNQSFEHFNSLDNGLRAGMVLLINYKKKYNINTIDKLVHKFAPKHENDTENYILNLSSYTGYGRYEKIDLENKDTLVAISKYIIFLETSATVTKEQLAEVYKNSI